MDRDTDRSRLIRNRSRNRLTNPPGRIGRKLVALAVIKFFNRFDQTQVAFLNQIQEQHTTAHITLCNADNQTQVGLRQTLFGFLIAVFHSFCKLDFLFCRQKRNLTDFL